MSDADIAGHEGSCINNEPCGGGATETGYLWLINNMDIACQVMRDAFMRRPCSDLVQVRSLTLDLCGQAIYCQRLPKLGANDP